MKSPLKIKLFLVFIIISAVQTIAFSQPGDPASDPQVPISGIEILIAAGALLGVRKFARLKKKR